MTEEELEAVYGEYLCCQWEVLEMLDQGIASGDRWDRVTTLRDQTWQRYADAYGPAHGRRAPIHLDASADRRPFERGERSERVAELQERLGVEPVTGVYDDRTAAFHRYQYATRWFLDPESLDEPPEPTGLVTSEAPPDSDGFHRVAADTPNTIDVPPDTSGHWILALEATAGRAAATTYNLATMASLAYSNRGPVGGFFEGLGSVGDRQSHSREMVRELRLSESNLCSILRRVDIDQGYGRPEVIDEQSTDTQLFMVECPQHILVAFRGTLPTRHDVCLWHGRLTGLRYGFHDFIRDANAIRVPYPFGTDDDETAFIADSARWMARADMYRPLYPMEVHEGFLYSFDAVREVMYNFVCDAGPGPSKPIFITGHSLGGAIAVHAACYLSRKLANTSAPVVCYTFGQPRVGDRDFASHFMRDFAYYRVTNIGDLVPRVPYTVATDSDSPMAHWGRRYDCGFPSAGLYDAGTPELVTDPLPPMVGNLVTLMQHTMPHYLRHCVADVWRALLHQRGYSTTPSSIVPLSGAALPAWEIERWEEHHHGGIFEHRHMVR